MPLPLVGGGVAQATASADKFGLPNINNTKKLGRYHATAKSRRYLPYEHNLQNHRRADCCRVFLLAMLFIF